MAGIEEGLAKCAMFGMKPGLDSIRRVCASLGNPQDALKVVHVAGTNGKGATCALIDSSLRAAGFSAGRYTSPHLVSLTERFLLNGKYVDEKLLDKVYAAIPESEKLTYFELLTAVSFELYRQASVDWLVLETGLGGRLDATNIVSKPEVCVITRIGLDHCDWLGKTLPEIAAEKGGIIKSGVPVVLGAMPDEAREILQRIAAERDARCIFAPDIVSEGDIPRDFALEGKFNRENALTALAALKVIGIDRSATERSFASVAWPGRFQKIVRDEKCFIVDGAHNPPAMRALVDAVKADGVAVDAAVCGFCGDKDVAENLRILREVTPKALAVAIRNPRSLASAVTADMLIKEGFSDVRACGSLAEALALAPECTLVCGSLFLAGETLELLNANPNSGKFFFNEKI
jgi:dihydrofolate synthase/folylpolyglutamate synthase